MFLVCVKLQTLCLSSKKTNNQHPQQHLPYLVGALAKAHEEVVGLDVAVDEAARVHKLDAREQLVGEHQHRLEAELAVAEVEEVLEGGAEQVDDHDVVVALDAVPAHVGDADFCFCLLFVCFCGGVWGCSVCVRAWRCVRER